MYLILFNVSVGNGRMDNEQPHQELVKCVIVGDTGENIHIYLISSFKIRKD